MTAETKQAMHWAVGCQMPVLGDTYTLVHDGTVNTRGMEAFVALVGPNDNQEAHARLITAAPDLFELAILVRDLHETKCLKPEACLHCMAERVIAAVEGTPT